MILLKFIIRLLFIFSIQIPVHADSAATKPVDYSLRAAAITNVDDQWVNQLPRDPLAATEMYMQRIAPIAANRANAYFEGGYWLQLWNLISFLVISWILLGTGAAAKFRDFLESRIRSKGLYRILFSATYLFVIQLLSFPLAIYQNYFRERDYGLINQTFSAWFGEQLIGIGLVLLFGSLILSLLYYLLGKWPQSWTLLGTGLCILALSLIAFLGPVMIDPLFNTYKKVQPGTLRTSLLAMAAANGIPAEDIFEFNASKQSDRVSANVSGLFNTTSIRLNDNLLRRSTPAEVRAVMGHEMGHYVLNHINKSVCLFAIIIFLGFNFIDRSFTWFTVKRKPHWSIKNLADMAGIPLVAALFSIYMFLMTPINNTIIRTQEQEADVFGLNVAREPDAEAEVNLKLTEYRKPDPGPIEEFIFFDHPAARTRILTAMTWKANQIKKTAK